MPLGAVVGVLRPCVGHPHAPAMRADLTADDAATVAYHAGLCVVVLAVVGAGRCGGSDLDAERLHGAVVAGGGDVAPPRPSTTVVVIPAAGPFRLDGLAELGWGAVDVKAALTIRGPVGAAFVAVSPRGEGRIAVNVGPGVGLVGGVVAVTRL